MSGNFLQLISLLMSFLLASFCIASNDNVMCDASNEICKLATIKIQFMPSGIASNFPTKINLTVAIEKEGSNVYLQKEAIVSNGSAIISEILCGKCELRVHPTECTSYFRTNMFLGADGENVVIVPILPVFTVSGKFVDPNGNALENVDVILSRIEEENNDEISNNAAMVPPIIVHRVFTNREGRFNFDGIGSGKYIVFAKHNNYAIARKSFSVKDKNVELGNIVLNFGEKIRGLITDSDAHPISNIIVCLRDTELSSKPYTPWSTFRTTFTDSKGTFVFNNLEGGKYKIELYENSNNSTPIAVLDGIKSDKEPVHIFIERGFPCVWQVVDSSNAPIEDVLLDIELISELGLKKIGSELTDAEGKIVRSLMENSMYRFSFFKYGYLSTNMFVDTTDITLSPSGTFFRIVMEKGNVLTGQLLDSSTAKPAGKGFVIIPDSLPPSFLDWQATNVSYITDDNGYFKLEGLPSGSLRILVYKLKRNFLHCVGESMCIIDSSKTNFLNIFLPLTGTITGYVSKSSNVPIAQGKVVCIRTDDDMAKIKYYGDITEGSFKIEEVLPGEYKVLLLLFSKNSSSGDTVILKHKDKILVKSQETNTLRICIPDVQSEGDIDTEIENYSN